MKEIEKKIKKDANNASFEFKEEYWDAALIKLKQAERKKIIKRFFWIFGLTVLIGGVSYVTWGKLNDSSNQSMMNITQTEQLKTNKKEGTNAINKNQKTIVKNDKNPINSQDGNSNNQLNSLGNNVNSTSSNSVNNSNSTSRGQPSNTKTSNNPLNNQVNGSFQSNSTNPVRQINNNVDLNNTNIRANVSTRNNSSNTTNSNSTANLNSNNNSSITNAVANLNQPNLNESASNVLELEKIGLPIIQINLIDSILTQFNEVNVPVIIDNSIKRLSLQAFAGGVIHKKFNSEKGSNLTLPYVGLELRYRFSQPLSISTGIGYYQLNMNPLEVTIEDKVYGFGMEHNTGTLSLEKSNWFEIPLKLTYNFANKHFISLGGEYSILVSAKNSVSNELTYTNERFVEDNVTGKEMISKEYERYTTPYFNSMSLFASYQFQYNRLGAEIKYHYGMNDIINDEIIWSEFQTNEERSHRFTFTLKYSIF